MTSRAARQQPIRQAARRVAAHDREPALLHAPPDASFRIGELHRAIGNQAVGRLLLQRKLVVNQPGDVYEREADRVADAVMRAPPAVSRAMPAPRALQRACSCGGTCAGCRQKEEKLQRKEASTITVAAAGAGAAAPPIVHEVLRSTGQPLDAKTRSFMEPRFGRSFADVRIHANSRAAESARSVGARAYTVGRDIVFGGEQYAPHTESGRHLLAHELTHTAQQANAPVMLQRACVEATCPAVLVPVPAVPPFYNMVEKCIQDLYARTHPAKRGVSLSFNKDWVDLTGGSGQEKLALSCLRGEETPGAGPNFTAKAGTHAGEPDIWDFRNQTMYEITSPLGAAWRIPKLAAEITLANKICGTADCGGLLFGPGTWSPPEGCFSIGWDLYFKATNNQGVIIYNLLMDPKKVAVATALALAAAAAKKGLPKLASKLGGKALGPAYVVGTLTAMAVLLASGRAEAKLGPGDEEPIAQLFKAMEQKGTPVPKEIQEMLEANPDLKAKMNEALKKGGDPSKLQEELNKQILDTIAANKDQFTEEELELLLASTQAASSALPKANMTVDELKKLAEAAKAGKTGGEGKGGGGGTGPSTKAPPPPQPEAAKEADTKDAPGKKPAPKLSQTTRDNLAKAPAPVRDIFNSLLGTGDNALKLSDADVQRFLSIVPADLSADQVKKVRDLLKGATGKSVDEVLDALQAAVAMAGKPPAPAGKESGTGKEPGEKPADAPSSETAKPDDTATLSTEATGGGATTDPQKLIQELAAKAKKTSFDDLKPGNYQIAWVEKAKDRPPGAKLAAGSTILSGSVRGRHPDTKKAYVGRIDADVISVDPNNSKKLRIRFTRVTPMVGADGSVVYPATRFLGQERDVVLDPPKSRKRR
jgi:ribosomal protein L12E/L44/L45/RPP1/RPP2